MAELFWRLANVFRPGTYKRWFWRRVLRRLEREARRRISAGVQADHLTPRVRTTRRG